MYDMTDLKLGQRVELAPHTDLWMRGARYGTVVRLGRKRVQVKLDRAGIRAIAPADIGTILDTSA